MSHHARARIHGTRIGAQPVELQVDTGPAFMTDPARGCAPGKANAEDFHSTLPGALIRAKQACARCPFTVACLTYALDHGETHGVWAGVSMSATVSRQAAADKLGWTPPAKPPTEDQLRAARVTAAAAEKARVEGVVRAMHADGKSDGDIALHLGIAPGTVNNVRTRLRLPTLYGPGGRRLDHELVR